MVCVATKSQAASASAQSSRRILWPSFKQMFPVSHDWWCLPLYCLWYRCCCVHWNSVQYCATCLAPPYLLQLQVWPQLHSPAVQHVLPSERTSCVSVRRWIFWHGVKIAPPSLNQSIKKHTSPLSYCQYIIHTTLFSLFSSTHIMYLIAHHRPFLFSPQAQTRRYSCYHTHTAFTDMTDITARGMFASAQATNHLLRALMKSRQRGQEAEHQCPEGGFDLSASDLPRIDSWKKRRVPRIPVSIWPHPPHLFFLVSSI